MKRERMEPFGIRIAPSLRVRIEQDGKARKPKETPSDVAREILENHYNKKGKKNAR